MALKDIKDFAWIPRPKPPVYEKMKINIDGSYELSFIKYCHKEVYKDQNSTLVFGFSSYNTSKFFL